ncbi:nucleotide-diphospho-sugar transferase [Pluteus cervinus]|uniref:Nucleotide-diphospho-sugar transferase n=1 Tax=Pluteus cervinus TaxID=181527 RepID=A0ACD3BHE4_9AGAR|nr:nucleotide-diphospho-sugar transferase [Pluteus cervinus]
MSRKAYVTLLTKPSYLAGTLVLDNDLRVVGSKYPLVVMITPGLGQDARNVLVKRGIPIIDVETLQPAEGTHTLSAHDQRFADTWTKLRGFELVQYDRVIMLDCDMIVKRNMDELMETELPKDEIAAVHVCACNPRKLKHYPADWIPENCAHTAVQNPTALPPVPTATSPRPYGQLNGGLVILNPSKELAEALVHFLNTYERISEFSFPDQDLLTVFFEGKWRPVSWRYNALRTLRYVHPNEWSDDVVSCVHYILPDKPWQSRNTPEAVVQQLGVVNKWWWDHFDRLAEEVQRDDPEGWKLVTAHVDNTPASS